MSYENMGPQVPMEMIESQPLPAQGQNANTDNAKWQMICQDLYDQVEQSLRSLEWIDNQLKRPEGVEPKANEKGISSVMSTLKFYVNKNTISSNYDEKRIKEKCRYLKKELILHLFDTYKDYKMDLRDLPLMIRAIVDACESCYRRALNGEAYKGQISMNRVTNAIHTGQDQQKFSWWPFGK